MNKEKKEYNEKLQEWYNMDTEEKVKWNGFPGFLKNERFKDTSIFMKTNKPSEKFR